MSTKFTKAKATTLAEVTEMVWHKTTIRMYGISESQLEELATGYNSWYLVLFGIFAGAAVSLWIAFTQTTSQTDRPYYLGAFVGAMGMTVLTGLAGFTKIYAAHCRKKKLYEESIPIDVFKRQG